MFTAKVFTSKVSASSQWRVHTFWRAWAGAKEKQGTHNMCFDSQEDTVANILAPERAIESMF